MEKCRIRYGSVVDLYQRPATNATYILRTLQLKPRPLELEHD